MGQKCGNPGHLVGWGGESGQLSTHEQTGMGLCSLPLETGYRAELSFPEAPGWGTQDPASPRSEVLSPLYTHHKCSDHSASVS